MYIEKIEEIFWGTASYARDVARTYVFEVRVTLQVMSMRSDVHFWEEMGLELEILGGYVFALVH